MPLMQKVAGTPNKAIKRERYFYYLKIACSIGYLAALIYLVFFAKRRRDQHIRFLNIVPFKNTINGMTSISYRNGLTRDIYSLYSNLIGNILLFVPLSIIAIVILKIYKSLHILLLAFAVSFLIEIFQYTFCIGVADIDDIILNVGGAVTGIAFYNLFKKKYRSKTSHLR